MATFEWDYENSQLNAASRRQNVTDTAVVRAYVDSLMLASRVPTLNEVMTALNLVLVLIEARDQASISGE